jgi:hypothetical protein
MTDPKRGAFRDYLEENGVIDGLNRAMTALSQCNPLPPDPLAFVREQLGAPPVDNIDVLIRQNQDLTAELYRLQAEFEAQNT